MLGLFKPDEGTIEYDGKPYSSFSDEEQRELRTEIGMLFQGGALFDSMTVEENVMFPLRMFTNQKRGEMRDRVHEYGRYPLWYLSMPKVRLSKRRFFLQFPIPSSYHG